MAEQEGAVKGLYLNRLPSLLIWNLIQLAGAEQTYRDYNGTRLNLGQRTIIARVPPPHQLTHLRDVCGTLSLHFTTLLINCEITVHKAYK